MYKDTEFPEFPVQTAATSWRAMTTCAPWGNTFSNVSALVHKPWTLNWGNTFSNVSALVRKPWTLNPKPQILNLKTLKPKTLNRHNEDNKKEDLGATALVMATFGSTSFQAYTCECACVCARVCVANVLLRSC